jgi:hypothetical protein
MDRTRTLPPRPKGRRPVALPPQGVKASSAVSTGFEVRGAAPLGAAIGKDYRVTSHARVPLRGACVTSPSRGGRKIAEQRERKRTVRSDFPGGGSGGMEHSKRFVLPHKGEVTDKRKRPAFQQGVIASLLLFAIRYAVCLFCDSHCLARSACTAQTSPAFSPGL